MTGLQSPERGLAHAPNMSQNTDGTHVVTTRSAEAAAHYRDGLTYVVKTSALARSSAAFDAAVTADDHFAVALAALAVVLDAGGMARESAVALARAGVGIGRATRRERQHVEIVGLFLGADRSRARALGAAHLQDFAGDVLISWLMSS